MAHLYYLLTNARIYTMDSANPQATSILLRGETVQALNVESVPTGGLVQNLEGGCVLPGFIDAHIHWEWTSMNLKRIDLFDLPSLQAALERVGRAAQNAPPGDWLTGFGWAQGPWEDTAGAFPTAADLDAVAPDHPVFLSSRSGHAGWANSAALRVAGVSAATENPEGGEIQRGTGGRPTGIFFEEAMGLIARHVPEPTPEEVADQMEQAQEQAWRCGLTGIHDYDGPRCFSALQLLQERGTLGLRAVKNINDPYIHHAHALGLRWGYGNSWLRLGGLKIFADGALGSLTARMLDPYEGQPENRGITVTPPERILELASSATRLGFPATIHAIGDEAVRQVLDVLQEVRALEAQLGIPRHARRHRIEHVQVIHPDDVHRLAELDIIASMQPIHGTADYPVADRYWGARCALSYNPRTQIDAGARVAFGSDSPVEPFAPLLGIHAAVTRRRPDGSPGPDGWYPQARITAAEAIGGYTTGPAWAAGLEHHQGRLAPGCFADLVLLDRDPFTCPPDELHQIHVLGTMVGGKWRWKE